MSSSLIDRSRSGPDPSLKRCSDPRLQHRFAASAGPFGAILSKRFTALAAVVLAVAAVGLLSVPAAHAGTTTINLVGTGAVKSNLEPGIDCSNIPDAVRAPCVYDFGFLFAPATMTATAGPGQAFAGWSGGDGTCIGSTNPCQTGAVALNRTMTATFAPAPDRPAVITGDVTDVDFPSATVQGTVNPGSTAFPVTSCYVEFGLTDAYGERASCSPNPIPLGTSALPVTASIGVLEPDRTYHYRVVAVNGSGASRGQDRTFVSGDAPNDLCPNAAVRAAQGAMAQRLPRCGAYELVSPPSTGGAPAVATPMSADGTTARIVSGGGFADVESPPGIAQMYLARRTASGWMTTAVAPPASAYPYMGQYAMVDQTRDGARSLWLVNTKADVGTRRFTPIVREPDGAFLPAGPTQDDQRLPVGASANLRTVLQEMLTRPPLTDGTVDSRTLGVQGLYASTRGDDGQLKVQQVAYREGTGSMFPECPVYLGRAHNSASFSTGAEVPRSVSSNGEKIFFSISGSGTACPAATTRRVWVKVGDADPIDISAPQCPDGVDCGDPAIVSLRGASADGSRVYFTTTQRLLEEDKDTTGQNDLYEYDFNATGPNLRLVTGGPDPVGADVSPDPPFSVSPDGAYVYFVAGGRPLAGPNARGASPQTGAKNLYVYRRTEGQSQNSITFIGVLTTPTLSSFPPFQISETGRFALLRSSSDLTSEKLAGDTAVDVFHYDADNDRLKRVWSEDAKHNGANRVGEVELANGPTTARAREGWDSTLQISEDGALVGFTTTAALSHDDRNTTPDAYLWESETGRFTLLSAGSTIPQGSFAGRTGFRGMTPSGDSLFITSSNPFVPEHTSGQTAAYVIRRNGGFLDKAPAPELPCAGDACQGSASAQPMLPNIGSVAFDVDGNLPLNPNRARASVRVSKFKAVTGSTAKLKVRVPDAGRIVVAGSSVRRTIKPASKAGTYSVKIKLKPRAMRLLKQRARLKVNARVSYRARSGESASKTIKLTFKQRKSKRTKAKKGGR